MIRLGVVGCTGKFGRDIMSYALNSNNITLNTAITRSGNKFVGEDISVLINGQDTGIIITDSISNAKDCDVFVDCTNIEAFMLNNLPQYEKMGKAVIIATTGLSDSDFDKIKQSAKQIPILFSSNYSFGLYNFIETVKKSVSNIDAETDVQIIEYHHNEKKDSPSGTAISILDSILEANPKLIHKDIKINSVRAGSIVGEHRVLIANSNDEEIELVHKVSTRKALSSGIVKSAIWICSKPSGYYYMSDVIRGYNT